MRTLLRRSYHCEVVVQPDRRFFEAWRRMPATVKLAVLSDAALEDGQTQEAIARALAIVVVLAKRLNIQGRVSVCDQLYKEADSLLVTTLH